MKPLLTTVCVILFAPVLTVAQPWSAVFNTQVIPQPIYDADEPGVTPPKLIDNAAKPNYTAAAMKAKVQGVVTVAFVVAPDGTPTDIHVTRSLDKKYGLDTEAVKALKQWRFKPGTKDGKPVAVRQSVEMAFTIGMPRRP